jgi:hypothetical protein
MQPNRQVQRKPRKPSAATPADRCARSAVAAPKRSLLTLRGTTGDNRLRSVHDRRRPHLMAEDELAEVPRSLATSLKPGRPLTRWPTFELGNSRPLARC